MIEVMIVLAVTGLMFVGAVILINGRQNRTQFMTAINGMRQQVQQVINETSNGFYPRDSAFACVKGASTPPVLSVATSGDYQGKNAACIFMGKVMQFGVAGTDPQAFQTIPIIGNRTDPSSNDVESSTLYGSTGAYPEAAARGTARNPTITGIDTSTLLPYGLRVVSMWYGTSAANTFGAVGFRSSLPSANGTGINSGSQSLGLYRVVGSALSQATPAVVDLMYPSGGSTPLMPVSSVSICVASGTTDQSGLIVIGADNTSSSISNGLAVNLTIRPGQLC